MPSKSKSPAKVADDVDDVKLPDPERETKVEIPFRGVVFTVPKYRGKWSLKGSVAIAEKQYNVAVKYLLGRAQWDALCLLVGDENDSFNEFFLLFSAAIKRECVD